MCQARYLFCFHFLFLFHTCTHTHTHAAESGNVSLFCREDQPAKTPTVHEIFVMHSYSLHRHTQLQGFAPTQVFVCSNVSRHMRYTRTCTLGTRTRTRKFESQKSTKSWLLPDGVCTMCVIATLVFLICDVALRLQCVCICCVFVFVYMCGRLVLPCFLHLQPLDCSPNHRPKNLFITKMTVKKNPPDKHHLLFSLSHSVDL